MVKSNKLKNHYQSLVLLHSYITPPHLLYISYIYDVSLKSILALEIIWLIDSIVNSASRKRWMHWVARINLSLSLRCPYHLNECFVRSNTKLLAAPQIKRKTKKGRCSVSSHKCFLLWSKKKSGKTFTIRQWKNVILYKLVRSVWCN